MFLSRGCVSLPPRQYKRTVADTRAAEPHTHGPLFRYSYIAPACFLNESASTEAGCVYTLHAHLRRESPFPVPRRRAAAVHGGQYQYGSPSQSTLDSHISNSMNDNTTRSLPLCQQDSILQLDDCIILTPKSKSNHAAHSLRPPPPRGHRRRPQSPAPRPGPHKALRPPRRHVHAGPMQA